MNRTLFTLSIANLTFLTFSDQTQGKEITPPFSQQNVETIQKKVSDFSKEVDDTGVLLLVRENGKNHTFSAGWGNRKTKTPIQVNTLFEIGSMTKVFTAVAIQQLIEQKKLSLDTPINTFYPSGKITELATFQGKNHWNQITIGMLLNHTSGIIDYLNVYHDDAKAMKILGGKGKSYTFDQLIKLAVDHGEANFKPGEKFEYCNTGYILLGDLITKVSGMDWHDYIQKNIFTPVGMKRTYFGSRLSEKSQIGMPQGYFNKTPSFMPPTLAGSAGEIISTLDDLALFMDAWSHGKLYTKQETLKRQLEQGFLQMSPLYNNLFYGSGIMKSGNLYGHGGQTFGFQSYMATNIKTGTIYIIAINDSTVNSMDLLARVSSFKLKKE